MYELAVLLHPDLEIDLDPVLDEIKEMIASHDGQLQNLDVWGKRKLAYQIQGEQHAMYAFFTLDINPQEIDELQAELNMKEEVLRYLLIKAQTQAKVAEEEE